MGARESDPGGLTRILRGKEAVVQAAGAARAFGEAQWLTEDEGARLCIIVEELVANLYDHGGLSETDEVEISLASEPGGIRIVIVDPGPPFDPRSAPAPREQPERGGGAGIDIVRAWAEIVDYSLIPEGNRLELLLPVGG
jgi:anti-sigma regulatory factor (Ser/Thr protein kinase)